jgi:PTH1 family peptidyl-tRNA hydrolase
MIKVMVGLGNPGREYQETRHNAGFLFLDYLANSAGAKWVHANQFSAEMAEFVSGRDKLLLLKPMTYMNKSGFSVARILNYYKIKPDQMLVVHDELELPEGVVKMKRDGGHAGHNGLRDIIAHINTRDFYRLRIGIGRPASGANIADYVLSKPSAEALRVFLSVYALLESRLNILLEPNVDAVNNAL